MKNCKVNGRSRKLNLEQAAVANLACAWCISLANGTHSSPVHDSSPVSWHSHMKRACTDLSRVSYVLVGGRERSVMLRSTVLCARQLRRMTIIVFFHQECKGTDDELWTGDWCVPLANTMHQGQARFATATCSQIKLTVSLIYFTAYCFNAISSRFILEMI